MIEMLSTLSMSSSGNSAAAAGIVGLFTALIAGFYGIFILLYCVIFIFVIICFVFWIWMLIDALQRKDYDHENDRLLWCLIILLGQWLGAVVYYFLVKKKKDPPNTKSVSTTSAKPEVKPPSTVTKPLSKPEIKK